MKGKRILKMPFGKYRGKEIEDIPSEYLNWLAAGCDNEEVATAADEEYQYREKYNCHIWKD